MGREVLVLQEFTITSTETTITIAEGEAVTFDGKRANTTTGFAGVCALGDVPPGSPITVQTGRVRVKYSATPGAGADLTIGATGQFLAAVATNIVVGNHLEDDVSTDNDLGIAYIAQAYPVVKA